MTVKFDVEKSSSDAKKIQKEIDKIYKEFSSKVSEIEKERDAKIMQMIEKLEKRQIEDIKNTII